MEPDPIAGYSIEKTPSGEYYYVNEETGETQWERPIPSPVIGYTLGKTPGGAYYYVHNITGDWCWERPQPDLSVPPPPPDSAVQVKAVEHYDDVPSTPWVGPDFQNSREPDLSIAKIAIFVMVGSLMLPYVSIGNGIVTYSGVDILEDWYELVEFLVDFDLEEVTEEECQYANDGVCDEPLYCASGTDGEDCADSGSSGSDSILDDVPIRLVMLVMAGFMLLLSPLFILTSGVVSWHQVFSNEVLPKLMGKIHLFFFGLMFALFAIGGTVLDDMIGMDLGISVIETLGLGLWMGALSGLGLVYEKTS